MKTNQLALVAVAAVIAFLLWRNAQAKLPAPTPGYAADVYL